MIIFHIHQLLMKQDLHYKHHKSLFENIKEEERAEWIRNMLQIEQKKGEYPLYKKQYPHHGKWKHNGEQLHYYYELSKVQPAKAILFYFPGMNAHAGGSAYFTMGLAEKCHLDVYGFDYKNFGRSTGNQRGYMASVDQAVKQAEDFVEYILSQRKQKVKVYISGLSLGGGVCFKLAIRHPQWFDGVIFLSPSLRENKQVQPFMKKIAKFLGTFLPTTKTVSQTFNSATKYDQTARIMQDQFVYKDKVIPGTVKAILDFMGEIEGEWDKFATPFILVQSGVDKFVDPFQAIDFEKQCKSTDKTVIYFKDMWHAVFGEDELPQVIEAVNEWLQPRVNK